MQPRNICLISTLFVFLLAVLIAAFSLPEVNAQNIDAVRIGKAGAKGEMQNGFVEFEVTRGRNEQWPTDGPIGIWLTNLDGKPLVSADVVEDARAEGRFTARMAVPVPAGKESLYVMRYSLGSGDDKMIGAISFAEIVGALQLRVLGPDTFQAGSQSAVRVIASDRFGGGPVAGANIKVLLRDKKGKQVIYKGRTDAGGTCDISFAVPDKVLTDPSLIVVADRRGQMAQVENAIRIKRTAKVLLTTDKPLYQPGQTMHIRALALGQANRKPLAKKKALIEVMDAKGNKVFKRRMKTNQYGIVAAVFTLASEVNMGNFQIKVTVDEFTAEKSVEVKHYVLPKFKIGIKTDRKWYTPGRKITGTVNATYIFGKPVKGGEIELEGLASIVGTETFAKIKGKTNAEGNFEFSLDLPKTLVGRQVDQGLARVQLHATVTGPDGSTQEALKSYPVAKSPLVVRAVPESGRLVPKLKNRIYALVTTPDGTPVEAKIMAHLSTINVGNWQEHPAVTSTDELGLAEFEMTVPQHNVTLVFHARDKQGNEVESAIEFSPERQTTPLLLRTDKATYRLGEVIALTALVGDTPFKSVFFDLVRNNQTLLTTTGEIKDGKATVQIPVSEQLVGGVVATAYTLLPHGNMVRDNRVIYVHPKSDLNIAIKPGKKIYRPGDDARIDFAVTDRQGHPVAAALGVTIVDEAVFALQDMQPGLEKIFFTLERELMKPRYEFHSFTPEQIVLDPTITPVKERGWKAMLAAVEPMVSVAIDQRKAVDESPEIRAKLEGKVRTDMKVLEKKLKKVDGDLNKLNQRDLLDAWSTPYRVSGYWNEMIYRLISAGPDRVFNTRDDINVENKQYVKELSKRKMRQARGVVLGAIGGAARNDMDMLLAENGRFMAQAAPKAANKKHGEVIADEEAAGPAVRVREYFPETLYVNPALITDGQGKAHIRLPMADSITTWRIAAQAVSSGGMLGSGTGPVIVFQDFFVDINFPVALTRNDTVKVPIALYNYLPEPQTIKLKIEDGEWYELVEGKQERRIKLGPNEVKAEYIHVKAKRVGEHKLTVYAYGSKQNDAVRRPVRVEPDGKLFEHHVSNQLTAEAKHTAHFPAEAIEGANKLFIKIYPGLMSQVVEGLDNIFRMPGGCFEQTSSATYPNVMVLDYMKTTKQISPELQMKAAGFINQGYQRLVTFEVPGGGFEWFGRAPAHIILTAYGLMEFYDMSKVYEVDPALIKRTQKWLASKQQGDGSWEPNERYLDRVAAAFGKNVLRNTAYVTWALARTGDDGAAVDKGVNYLKSHYKKATDAYTLALIANALAVVDKESPSLHQVFVKLNEMRKDEEDMTYWSQDGPTAVRSRGKSANIETTALVAQALLIAKRQADVVNRIVKFLIKSKDSFGTYYSTQATVYAMQVFLMVARGGGSEADGEVQVMVNGDLAGGFTITPADSDVLRLIDAGQLIKPGANEIVINFAGRGSVMYQVVDRHYIQWSKLRGEKKPYNPISINVAYDKTELAVNDEVTCTVTVENKERGEFGMVVVDIGVPPGFSPRRETLERLVAEKKISKFSTTARQVTFYLDKLEQGKALKLSFNMQAMFPMHAVAPQAKVYNYYDPETNAIAEPIELEVK